MRKGFLPRVATSMTVGQPIVIVDKCELPREIGQEFGTPGDNSSPPSGGILPSSEASPNLHRSDTPTQFDWVPSRAEVAPPRVVSCSGFPAETCLNASRQTSLRAGRAEIGKV